MCPCCNDKSWKNEEGFICRECNYRYIAVKELGSCSPTYCEECGCGYSNGCDVHDASVQKKI